MTENQKELSIRITQIKQVLRDLIKSGAISAHSFEANNLRAKRDLLEDFYDAMYQDPPAIDMSNDKFAIFE